tara:strand:- start:868 stop:1092 length:225 start_codon:yes stop_codon:yes gene_type:complete
MNNIAPNPYSGYEIMFLEFGLDYLSKTDDYDTAVKHYADFCGCSVEDMEELLKVGQTMLEGKTELINELYENEK